MSWLTKHLRPGDPPAPRLRSRSQFFADLVAALFIAAIAIGVVLLASCSSAGQNVRLDSQRLPAPREFRGACPGAQLLDRGDGRPPLLLCPGRSARPSTDSASRTDVHQRADQRADDVGAPIGQFRMAVHHKALVPFVHGSERDRDHEGQRGSTPRSQMAKGHRNQQCQAGVSSNVEEGDLRNHIHVANRQSGLRDGRAPEDQRRPDGGKEPPESSHDKKLALRRVSR